MDSIFFRSSFQISFTSLNWEFGKRFSLICSEFYTLMAMTQFKP
jgi:hypothetical protein